MGFSIWLSARTNLVFALEMPMKIWRFCATSVSISSDRRSHTASVSRTNVSRLVGIIMISSAFLMEFIRCDSPVPNVAQLLVKIVYKSELEQFDLSLWV
jgi:hypothetical protein